MIIHPVLKIAALIVLFFTGSIAVSGDNNIFRHDYGYDVVQIVVNINGFIDDSIGGVGDLISTTKTGIDSIINDIQGIDLDF